MLLILRSIKAGKLIAVSLSIPGENLTPIRLPTRHPQKIAAVKSTFKFQVVTVDKRGNQTNFNRGQARFFEEHLGSSTALQMVSIPGGTFLMGSPKDRGDSDEKPQHPVTLGSFYISKFPVTQAQWTAVAALPEIKIFLNPDAARFKGANRPVENVSWYEAVEFCARLFRKTGKRYRLPSEAQWEYACRGQTTGAVSLWGNDYQRVSQLQRKF